MSKLFENEAREILTHGDIEEIRRGLIARMEKASLEYLQEGRDSIFELFDDVRESFDGSEYQQGKKDGLRIALALLGSVGMENFNRGGSMARPNMASSPTTPCAPAGDEPGDSQRGGLCPGR